MLYLSLYDVFIVFFCVNSTSIGTPIATLRCHCLKAVMCLSCLSISLLLPIAHLFYIPSL